MKAAVLFKPGEIHIKTMEKPKVGLKDVLVEVRATGVCGTDILAFNGSFPTMSYPIVLGHEFSGIIAEVGECVLDSKAKIGDRIVAEPSWGCGRCLLCKEGKSNLCADGFHLGRDTNGSLAEYVVVPVKQIHKLPKGISFEEAQSVVTLACVVRAIKFAGVKLRDKVAVLGPGHAGLLALQVARAAGSSEVLVTGTRNNRLKLARALGADFTFNIRDENLGKAIDRVTSGLGVDVTIEATGTPSAVKQAVKVTKPGGTIIIFGVARDFVDRFAISEFYLKELKMLGVHGGLGAYETAITLLKRGEISVSPIITHVLPLVQSQKAFDTSEKRLENAIRVVVKP